MSSIEPSGTQAGHGGDATEIAALFDTESEGYDEAHEGRRSYLLHTRMAVVLETLGPGPGNALDAGMGPGRLCAELEARGWIAFGVDISERMVALAARRLPGARDRLRQGSITDLPFPDEHFDAVTATGVLEYLTDPAEGVAELVRVLAPGGIVVVSIPNSTSFRERWTARILYPAVRAAKRVLPGTLRPPPPHKPPALEAGALAGLLEATGAMPAPERYACAQVLPPPLDLVAPGLGRWLSERVQSSRTRLARALATQVIVAARKPGSRSDGYNLPPV